MPLSDISILITSFMRPGYLTECLKRIRERLPECPIIVVDDSGDGVKDPAITVKCPFDSGLTVKRNAGVKVCKTKYLLLGSDDFDFGSIEARQGVIKLYGVLENYPDLDIAAGRHNNIPYEGFLDYVPGQYIKETRLVPRGNPPFYKVDLCVNYFLAKTKTLIEVSWDEDIVPIGGEHGQFFLHLKEARKKVAWVPGVNIKALPYTPAWQHPDYAMYRSRAKSFGHKIFLKKRNVKDYYGFDEPLPKQSQEFITHTPKPTPPPPGAKLLIAITSCHRYRSRTAQQRDSWLRDIRGIDYRFFLGKAPNGEQPTKDEVFLPVEDNYEALPLKVQAACAWALENGYDYLFKLDDDAYCVPSRLLTSNFARADYVGRYRGASDWKRPGDNPSGYASGGPGYWLSRKAMQIVVAAKHNGDWAEDRWVGNVLAKAGIKCTHEPRFWLWPWPHGGQSNNLGDFITACDINTNLGGIAASMPETHRVYKQTGKLPVPK